MKFFVATRDGQGIRESDFCDAGEGEVLYWSMECDRDDEDLDGSCGCRRSLWGVETGGVTTTFAVVDLPLSIEWFTERVVQAISSKGWFNRDDAETVDLFQRDAVEMLTLAGSCAAGVVLEIRGEVVQIRQPLQKTQVSTVARERRTAELVHGIEALS